MTVNEMEVLRDLMRIADRERGARPLVFGGTSNSHHAQTAIRMIPKGWVERDYGNGWGKPNHPGVRGSCRYRITPAGEQAYANALACKELEGKST